MKVMICQPMYNRSEKEIKKERTEIIEKFEKMHIEVVDTLFEDEPPQDCNEAIYYLGKSIDAMKDIDALYLCSSWNTVRGCRIEEKVAREYGIKILDEDFFINKPEIGIISIK